MRELSMREVDLVDGGIAPLAVIGAAVTAYHVANIAYEFGKAFWEAV